jgi:predicted PhzF superfamily epimerase YddE/YHI9
VSSRLAGHGETAFVVPRADWDFGPRWFTPIIEDDLCGHATLASANVFGLQKHDVWLIPGVDVASIRTCWIRP